MKNDIHPPVRAVIFQDPAAEFSFLSVSSAPTKDTIVWEDGEEYPLIKVDISSASHPFYTGKAKFVDTAGRVDRFKNRFKWSDDEAGKRALEKSKAAAKRPKESKKKLPKATKKKVKKKAPAGDAAAAPPADASAAPAPAAPPAAEGGAPAAGGDAPAES